MITVLTVNYNSDDFLQILLKSLGTEAPVIVSENSRIPTHFSRATTFINKGEKTHGAGLNLGLEHIDTEYVLILDVDCHLLSKQWQSGFLNAIQDNDVITVAGPPQKPIRPACVFMKSQEAKQLDWKATEGYKGHRITPDGFDVGILAYHEMCKKGLKIKYMEVIKPSRYETLNGEEYALNGEPLVYHHWHGTHLVQRSSDYPQHDLLADKKKLLRRKTQIIL